MTCVNDEHPVIMSSDISKCDGILISFKEVQNAKHIDPIDVTLDGIVISVNDQQPEKHPFPIDVTCSGNWIDDSEVQ